MNSDMESTFSNFIGEHKKTISHEISLQWATYSIFLGE